MMVQDRVPMTAVIQDVSGLGRCSLSVSLPVLSVMGIQAVPMPTALLSTQTDGYTGYTFCNLDSETEGISRHWEALGTHFDAILSGFLSGARQVRQIVDVIARLRKKDTVTVVDPVMGDGGAAYDTVDRAHMDAMRTLARTADFITPNETEARILCGLDMQTAYPVRQLVAALCGAGYPRGVITGIRDGDQIGCAVYENDLCNTVMRPAVQIQYPGTGDLFAALFTGGLVRGYTPLEAVNAAVDFIGTVIRDTYRRQTPVREGAVIEPHLGKLITMYNLAAEPQEGCVKYHE